MTIVEIGAGSIEVSAALALGARRGMQPNDMDHLVLYEPNAVLRATYPSGIDVSVRPEAVSDIGGTYPFVHLGHASYLLDQPSFIATSIEPEGAAFLKPLTCPVPVTTINQAVTRDVDYLILTIGGGEGRLLRAMTARPATIETAHYCHSPVQWADTNRTISWLERAGYRGEVVARNTYSTFHRIVWRLDSAPQPV